MALKVVFIDDDETGLLAWNQLIPWEECGYEKATVFSCSADAMEYVRNNPVDVIITDICMSNPDGLEIAHICAEEQPHIKVILLSAHREFSYAQKALKYKNVVDYLTKPLEYNAIESILKKISQDAVDTDTEFSSSDDNYARMKFFTDLICGNIISRQDVELELLEMGIEDGADTLSCTLVVFNMKDFSEFLRKTSHYNYTQIYNAMSNLHPFSKGNAYFSLALHSHGNVTWVVLYNKEESDKITEDFVGDMIGKFRSVMDIEVVCKTTRKYASLFDFIDTRADDSEITGGISSDFIDKAICFMREHLSENIFLTDVAQSVYMSPNYFSSCFKQETGKKFIDALTELRMEEASKIFASNKDVSVLDVCHMVGYNHLGYFYKKFKKYSGVTPNEYKEMHHSE